MKRALLAMFPFLFAASTNGQSQIAHVISETAPEDHECLYELKISGKTYEALDRRWMHKCDSTLIGKDIPAVISKHHIILTVNGKPLKMEIRGVQE
jgi:hypothetical protein